MSLRATRACIASAVALAALLPGWVHAADPARDPARDPALEHARRLLDSTILVDGHNDLPITIRTDKTAPNRLESWDLRGRTRGQTDLPRLREGRVGAQFWSVYIPGELGSGHARYQLEQIELARRLIAAYPAELRLATSVAEIHAAKREGKIASLLGMEGGYALENSLGALRAYHDLGVRYMGLTHNTHTDWADSAAQIPPRHGGLTPFGESVVREMNRLGMLVDLAHASSETVADTLRVAQAPVIVSHAAARGVCDVPRNVSDENLRGIAANGGVVMVIFVTAFVDCAVAAVTQPAIVEYNLRSREARTPEERSALYASIFGKLVVPTTTVAQVADHIEHVRRVAGVDHVGLGSDFDGASFWPADLADVSMFPNLFAELVRRGWSDEDLRKLAGENLLRAFGEAERVAGQLRAQAPG